MRRARGNIILTALFVSIFLFFLSIALVWTNRQDITLVLAMEHKMKAEAAARSGAMLVLTSLRNEDKPPVFMEGTFENHTSWKAELVELPPEGFRGPVILLRSRGTSGPVSSYYTLHLLKNQLSGQDTENRRMLGFLNSETPPSDEQQPKNGSRAGQSHNTSQPPSPKPKKKRTLSSSAHLLLGDFILQESNLNMGKTAQSFAAHQGPLFLSSESEPTVSPLSVIAHLPVFNPLGGSPKAYGPVVLSLNAPSNETSLSVMTYQNSEFLWETIPPHEEEPSEPKEPPIARLELENQDNDSWTTIATRAVGRDGATFLWTDKQPATLVVEEATELQRMGEYQIDLNRTVDWGSVQKAPNQKGYSLRGAIASHKQTVYSHAWEYLYRQHDGAFPPAPVPVILGATVTRWPAVRKYDLESKTWSTAWSALDEQGNVAKSIQPDPDLLLADSQGKLYSRTLETPHRLLTLDAKGKLEIGNELPEDSEPFLYKDQPYTASSDLKRPGFVNLINNDLLGFETLPTHIPEISGLLITQVEGENAPIQDPDGLTMSPFETTPLSDPEQAKMYTVRPLTSITYNALKGIVASDGEEMYAQIKATFEEKDSIYETFGSYETKSELVTLARYDGARWHILPNGLMAALMEENDLTPPAPHIFCAHYEDLPKAKSRYTVVSISVDPFEFIQ